MISLFYGLLILNSVFYTKLNHLAQKLKKLRLDVTHDIKLNSNFYTELTHLAQNFKI